ncbi:homoserine kinase [Candidatus Viridilinea mediisalina]|uniref:Homoserine kinase n=1 Tax=Candidatus Viridilinea mediisalina TaxID=2024553 RepID=A0A2A6RJM5_9CHLR|nr:homoserine kinase [Candidatus Viridilinea mediisalina]PDW03089.1 homoserine kinase [Candidatus Viridilinea mediisalina]
MLTQYDVERALQNYDLGTVRSALPASHGVVNETAFAETSRGRYVVRRNQRKIGRASIILRHRLMAWLRARGFPAPRLVTTRSGETSVELDGRIFEVFNFIDGDEFNAERSAHIRGTGSILARYHRAVEGFPDAPAYQGPRYTTQSLPGLIERIMERDVMGDLMVPLNWYDRRASDLRRALPEAVYESLPYVLIHGDVHRDNLIFRGDVVAALIDFDQVTIDARLVDLADAMVDFAVGPAPHDWYPWGVYAGPLDATRARNLIEGYNEALPLTDGERAALPILIEVIWLQGNLRRVLMTSDAEPDYHLEVLGQGRRLSQWLAEHREVLLREL